MRSNPQLLAKPKLFLALTALLLTGWIMAATTGASSAPATLPFSSNYRLLYVQTSDNGRYGRLRQIRPANTSPTFGLFDNSLLSTVPIPNTCAPSNVQASPLGLWIAVQINCEAHTYTQIIEAASGRIWDIGTTISADHVLLGWMPQGDEFLVLVDNFVSTRVYRVNAANGQAAQIAVPDGVYQVTFSPDGQRMVYSLTRGLGYGSETWLAAPDGQSARLILSDPQTITAFVQWSPDGQHLAYLKMPDTVVPFSMGELWLMNHATGKQTLLSAADVGHGYRPVWSPDSAQIAFVGRENPDDPTADEVPEALVSNIYVVNVNTRATTQLTAFENSLVEQPAWSPDGLRIAFSARTNGKADIWITEMRNRQAQRITQSGDGRYPVWLPGIGVEAATQTAAPR